MCVHTYTYKVQNESDKLKEPHYFFLRVDSAVDTVTAPGALLGLAVLCVVAVLRLLFQCCWSLEDMKE